MRPSAIDIRWTPQAQAQVTLTIRDGEIEIWSATVDGQAGKLSTALNRAANKALMERQLDKAPKYVTLTIKTGSGAEETVVFSVLSRQDVKNIERDLANYSRESDPVLRAIERGSTYNSYKLFTEAADEFEGALQFAPESEDLLRTVLGQHRMMGNTVRERALEQKLQTR